MVGRVAVATATTLVACQPYGPPQKTVVMQAGVATPSSTASTASSALPAPSLPAAPPSPAPALAGSSTEPTSVGNADAVIAKNRWRFKVCYDKALAKNPKAGGKVMVTVHVGPSGDVTGANLVSTTASAALSACIVDAFPKMVFTPPAPGPTATFTVPIVLSSAK